MIMRENAGEYMQNASRNPETDSNESTAEMLPTFCWGSPVSHSGTTSTNFDVTEISYSPSLCL